MHLYGCERHSPTSHKSVTGRVVRLGVVFVRTDHAGLERIATKSRAKRRGGNKAGRGKKTTQEGTVGVAPKPTFSRRVHSQGNPPTSGEAGGARTVVL
eukprot:COSAG02_NODE_1407_length_12764_cov_3781.882985_2_plen_98_part_00